MDIVSFAFDIIESRYLVLTRRVQLSAHMILAEVSLSSIVAADAGALEEASHPDASGELSGTFGAFVRAWSGGFLADHVAHHAFQVLSSAQLELDVHEVAFLI